MFAGAPWTYLLVQGAPGFYWYPHRPVLWAIRQYPLRVLEKVLACSDVIPSLIKLRYRVLTFFQRFHIRCRIKVFILPIP